MTLEITHGELVTLRHILDARVAYCAEQVQGCTAIELTNEATYWRTQQDAAQALYNTVKEQTK